MVWWDALKRGRADSIRKRIALTDDRRPRQIDKYRKLIHSLILRQKHDGKYSLKAASPLQTEYQIEFHGSKLKDSIAYSLRTPAKMIVSSLIVHRSTKMSFTFSVSSSFFFLSLAISPTSFALWEPSRSTFQNREIAFFMFR